ncbi:hypothetical protein BB561_000604 [Smittium simulii]|uniref:FAM86 N-terminal domain-containing protein n=1 Tax=Smittium simulii TaxID=133385 RepID=A0A2T9YYH3_9FUNG|nr:hypothetical protein BB561_000604 [Smittium simulii]
MDEKCVLCNCGTYEEHAQLLEWIQLQFWQRTPIRCISWSLRNSKITKKSKFLACGFMQTSILQKIIFDPLTIKYSPSNRYIVMFLKNYIQKVEEAYCDINDELIEFYVSLMSTLEFENTSSSFVYQTYIIDHAKKSKITLKVDQNEISNGTTGLRPW